MADYERGAYDPDQIRVFDGSEDDDETEGSRLSVLVVIALVFLASFAGVVWLAYERGVASGRNEPKVIAAEPGPDKVTPDNPGGTPTQYKGLKIYEQPAPDDGDQATPVTQTPSAAPPKPATKFADQRPAPMAQATPVKASPPPAPKTQDVATPETKVAATPPPAKPESQDTTVTTSEKPPAIEKTAPETTAASESPAPVKSGAYLLQIGSYKSQEEADAAWASDKAKHSSVLAGLSPDVKKVDLGDKGTWYRLRIASFADKTAANALCDKLKADGGMCFLAK